MNKKLKENDYLLEITLRLAVRKKDAAAVIALNEHPDPEDETEGDRVLDAVMDLIGGSLTQYEALFEPEMVGRRIHTLKEVEDLPNTGSRR
ncbi:MAG: hypothetical protein ACRD19_01340 [Terriglobia bacterium]